VSPLETRARELAIAAGVDPDSRVPRPDSERDMPAWCAFCDTAGAELNAHSHAGALAVRRKREAEALRANLRKRKDQARARRKPRQE